MPYWPEPPVWRPNGPPILWAGALAVLREGACGAPAVRVDLVLAEHAVYQHLEVQLAHAGDLGLARLLVRPDLEGRILLGQAAERDRHLLLVGLRLGLDRHGDDRVVEGDRLELDRLFRRGQRVARDDLLDADGGRDVARVDLLDVLAVVGVHHQDPPDALRAARGD